uniref:deoxynucleoside triphosphate triphosphohydrolase SAMHD1-like n=1 Tax=Styela clava TaxID=7725 RepID=UPI0019396449|nr:deoxynucleoside triphosphate triphosphohydrolase SAMHD1-like [Styela clava]
MEDNQLFETVGNGGNDLLNNILDDDDDITLSQESQVSVHFENNDDDDSVSDSVVYKVFNDPIHGHIMLHPLLVKIIDTPQFQRLRNVKQLGATYFVYPGGSHNRFEHCIGTSHLAGKLARLLQKNQRSLNITNTDVLCVEMAGLCHDLGHGPFSHMFDGRFLPSVKPNSTWTHEKGSCMMIDHLIKANCLEAQFDMYGITQTDVTFVKEMIAGVDRSVTNGIWPYKGRGEDKSFLYEIVSNERNKVDVDKWDYFARDCYHLGIRNSFDHNRFMQFIKVLKVEGERLQICARDKESYNLYEMFHTRSVLHRRAYQHRVANAIDHMICDAMVLAEPYIKYVGTGGVECSVSECVNDPVAFTKLNDNIFDKILHSNEKQLEPARKILERILRRQLYQIIGAARPISPMKLDEVCDQIAAFDTSGILMKGDLIANTTKFNYGMHDKNPIDSFKFFSKSDPGKPYHIRKEDVSPMLPDVFEESEIQIYCISDDKVDASLNCFKLWCAKMKLQPKSVVNDTGSLTPMKRPKPSSGHNGHISQDKRRKVPYKF